MKRIKLLDIVERQGENKYSLLFKDENNIAMMITTGFQESWAIITALKNIKPERPITHNLLQNIVSVSGLKVKDVTIANSRNNLFFANIQFEAGEKVHNMDCKPTDGISLALRNNVPIYVSDSILGEYGIPLPERFHNLQPSEKGINAILAKSLEKEAAKMIELAKVSREHIMEITGEIIEFVHSN